MNEFEFKIIGVKKGTRLLTSEKGDEWNIEDLPDAPTVALIGDRLLEHVEFVPKKEPEFYVIIPHFDREVRYALQDTEYVDFATKNRAGKFTEKEADALVAGLTALNARKVKVEA